MGKRLTWKPLCILFILALYLVFQIFVDYVNTRRQTFSKIKKEFSTEVTASLHTLSSEMESLLVALEREKNLNLFDANFSRRFFFSELSLSELDGIQVFSSNCQVVWNFQLFEDQRVPCFKGEGKSFFLSQYKGSPTVSVVKRLSFAGETYFIQGSLHLGSAWLRERPHLDSLLNQESIKIVSRDPKASSFARVLYTFFPKDKSTREEASMNLLINQYSYSFLGNLLTPSSPVSLQGEKLIFLLLMFLCFLIFVEISFFFRREKKFYESFENWCSHARGMEEKELYANCLKEARESGKKGFSVIYQEVSRLLAEKLQAHFETQTKLKKVEKELEHSQAEMKKDSKDKLQLRVYQSLLNQMENFSKPLNRDLEHLESIAERTLEKTSELLLKKTETMEGQISQWIEEARQVGYKKTMRSLQERAGLQEGSSMLEEQIGFFHGVSSLLISEMKSLSSLASESLKRKKEVSFMLDHLFLFLCDDKKEFNLVSTLENTVELYKILRPRSSFFIEKNDSELTRPPGMKRHELVSVLYHLFETYYLSQDEGDSLVFKLKFAREKEKDFLLISSVNKKLGGFTGEGLRSLKLAEGLLESSRMKLSHLKLGGSSLLSLEWEHTDSILTIREKELQHELGL